MGYVSAQSRSRVANLGTDGGDVQISGSIAVVYQNTNQMIADADVIVTGTFTGEQIVVPRTKPVDYPPRASGDAPTPPRDPKLIDQVELGHLDSAFNVSEVVKGQVGSKVYVAQSGVIGATAATSKPISEGPFFTAGNSYILFLKKPQAHEIRNAGGRSFYYAVGAYQGAYRIKNGKVYTRDIENLDSARLPKVPNNSGYGYRINGADLNVMLQELRSQSKK